LKSPSLPESKKEYDMPMRSIVSPQLTPATLSPVTSPSCFTPPPGLSLDDTSASECSVVDASDTEASGTQLEDVDYRPGHILRCEIAGPQDAQVCLKLSDCIADPSNKSGMPGCPSLGSINHHLGLCRPCDFVHRGGCRQGADCPFCHLCGPQQNKLKKKERQKFMKNTKRMYAYAAMSGQLHEYTMRPLAFGS
jgi:hypothetical protein